MKKMISSFITVVLFLFTTISLCLFLSFCSSEKVESVSTDTAMTEAQAQRQAELKELKKQIRLEKFDLILPLVMRKHNIDMWIHVMRETISDDFGGEDLGSTTGVFIFTDRGGDRIERAVLGRRWSAAPSFLGQVRGEDSDALKESGAYDIIHEANDRTEMPGGPKTEFDRRFKGVGKFVAERDPKRIALNFLEKLGPHEGGRSKDGISHTDYILLVKAIGPKYAKRLVSSDYMMHDYVSRPTKSELVLLKKMRKFITEVHERDWAKIVPGKTKFKELVGRHSVVVGKNKDRVGFRTSNSHKMDNEYVIQRGDLVQLQLGYYAGGPLLKSVFGNFYEHITEIGYVLRKGETEPPPEIKRAFADVMRIHEIIEDNIKLGLTCSKTYDILKQKLEEAGVIVSDSQQYFKELDPTKPQLNIDMHAAAQGSSTYWPAPRIGTYGPDWHHDMIIPPNHHFFFEYFVYNPMPEWGEGEHLLVQMHDSAIVTERGVEFLTPIPRKIRLLR